MNGRDGLIAETLRRGLRRARGLWRTLSGRRRPRAAIHAIRAGRSAWIDSGPILQLVLAIDNHDITGIQTRAQADAVAGSLRDGNGINSRNRVLRSGVFSDTIEVSTLRAALNGSSRNDGEIALGIDEKVHVDKLIGEKGVVGVAKDGLEFIGTGSRINLIVNGLQFSTADFGGVVAVIGIDGELVARTMLGVHLGKLILWQAKNHRYRLELGDDQESVGV